MVSRLASPMLHWHAAAAAAATPLPPRAEAAAESAWICSNVPLLGSHALQQVIHAPCACFWLCALLQQVPCCLQLQDGFIHNTSNNAAARRGMQDNAELCLESRANS
jgi:hypothetical protein